MVCKVWVNNNAARAGRLIVIVRFAIETFHCIRSVDAMTLTLCFGKSEHALASPVHVPSVQPPVVTRVRLHMHIVLH